MAGFTCLALRAVEVCVAGVTGLLDLSGEYNLRLGIMKELHPDMVATHQGELHAATTCSAPSHGIRRPQSDRGHLQLASEFLSKCLIATTCNCPL